MFSPPVILAESVLKQTPAGSPGTQSEDTLADGSPPSLLDTSNATLPVLPNVASGIPCENNEPKGSSVTLSHCGPNQFQGEKKRTHTQKTRAPACTVLAVRGADRLDWQSESQVRQMEGSRGLERPTGRRPTQHPPSGKASAPAARQSPLVPGLQLQER